jgi:hypothetical protein
VNAIEADPALAEAERRAHVAEDDLAYLARDTGGVLHAAQQRLDALARELDERTAESARRGAELAMVRRECERIHGRLPVLERTARAALELGERQRRELAEQRRVHGFVAAGLVAERASVALLAELLAGERAAANARLQEAHEQAAAAIGLAEQRASAALRDALETVRRLTDPAETELRLRADLVLATSEAAQLRTRLGACEDALRERERERERELQRERGIADEATRWASRVERELVLDPPHVGPGSAAVAAQPGPTGPPISPLRRRGPRVRLRHVS